MNKPADRQITALSQEIAVMLLTSALVETNKRIISELVENKIHAFFNGTASEPEATFFLWLHEHYECPALLIQEAHRINSLVETYIRGRPTKLLRIKSLRLATTIIVTLREAKVIVETIYSDSGHGELITKHTSFNRE